MRSRVLSAIAIPSLLVLSGCVASKTITTRSLLGEMTDLAGLAEFPNPPFTCKQFSSYDPKSVSADELDTWFANADRGHYLRIEEHGDRKEWVMMDADGPGAIVRIWSANPQGTLRIYLDHSETPVIEAAMTDVLGGKYPGIPIPIAGERSRGWNSYFPIPYAKHCKVTSDKGEFYYHINYRTFSPDSKVRSFQPADLRKHDDVIAETTGTLRKPWRHPFEPWMPRWMIQAFAETLSGEPTHSPAKDIEELYTIAPGDVLERRTPEGTTRNFIITGLFVQIEGNDPDLALRQLLLSIEFDGEETVLCPLGDFFGAAPSVNSYESLPLTVKEDGMMFSYWPMPFRESIRLRIRNTGASPVRLRFALAGGNYTWTDDSMYFHAQWKPDYGVATRPMQDWNYVDIKGKGVFVGAAFSIANPVKAWWGEGDEKIYVDGEEFPSHFGTGTEDYFGYAWCCNVPFSHAYHGQPRSGGPGNYGHTSNYRWHIIDRIPFTESFRFDMELWHWHAETKVDMSVVTYWYARPGATSNRPEITPDMLRVPELPPYAPPRVAGALEGEELTIVEKTGSPAPQSIGKCSNESHLWWQGAVPGDRLVLEFSAPEAGRYKVLGRFVKSWDYGIIQLSVNGENAGEPVDFFNKSIAVTKEMQLGEFELQKGPNQFAAEIVGTNENVTSKNYMFGLDYIRLERIP